MNRRELKARIENINVRKKGAQRPRNIRTFNRRPPVHRQILWSVPRVFQPGYRRSGWWKRRWALV